MHTGISTGIDTMIRHASIGPASIGMASIALAGIALLFASPAAAEYTGPGSAGARTVAEILEHPAEEVYVVIQGVLTEKIGEEEYRFSDGTGEILVEIDDEDLPAQPIDEKTRVEIHGEADKDFLGAPEIEVDMLRVIGG